MAIRPVSRPDSEISGAQKFLYKTAFGQLVLKGILVRPWVSKLVGGYMDCSLSKIHIKRFIRSGGIDMNDYPQRPYHSFNDFFTPYQNSAASAVMDTVNDVSIKLRGDSNGVNSYNMMVELAVSYFEKLN